MAVYLLKRVLLSFRRCSASCCSLRHHPVRARRPGGTHDRAVDGALVLDRQPHGRRRWRHPRRWRRQAQLGQGAADSITSKYRGAQGLDPAFIKSLEKQFGFDKPAPERFYLMMKNFLTFDFGKSYFRDVSVWS